MRCAFNRFRKTYCASIVSDYYQLSALSPPNAADNIRQLQRLVEQMTDLVSVGRLGRYELQKRWDLLKAHDDYLDFQRSYAEAATCSRSDLNIPPHVEFEPDLSQWLMLSESIFAENGWNEQTAIDIALSQRLDLANMQDQIADAQRKIRVAEDALGADLALAGSAAPASGDTVSQYELGLTGTLPLDRVA